MALFRRFDTDFVQFFVAATAAVQFFSADIEQQRAFATVEPCGVGVPGESGDAAEDEMRLSAAVHCREDVEVIGYAHGCHLAAVLMLALGHEDAAHCHHPAGVSDPACEGLIPDSHGHRVVAAHVKVLPPVTDCVGVDEGLCGAADFDRVDVTEIAVGDEILNGLIPGQRERRWYDLADQVGELARCIEHFVGFVGIHCHAGFAQHVLVVLQSCAAQRGVHIRPSTDDDGIDIFVIDDFMPLSADLWDAEAVGDALPRLSSAVADADDFDPVELLQFRDMHVDSVGAGADNADPNQILCHGRLSCAELSCQAANECLSPCKRVGANSLACHGRL